MAAPLRRCLIQLVAGRKPFHISVVNNHPSISALAGSSHHLHPNTITRNVVESTPCLWVLSRNVHTSCPAPIFRNTEFDEDLNLGVKMDSKKWKRYNTVLYPPQEEGDPVRPAEICHARFNIKYSPKKMWYIASMIRGMSVSEAKKQLSFYRRKGAQSVLEVLEEAEEIAVRDHNVEFKSNLWICDSLAGKGQVVKGLRKHMGPRYGIVHYRFVHYFVRLREGKPPEHYYAPPLTGLQKMEEYIREQRKRRIINSM